MLAFLVKRTTPSPPRTVPSRPAVLKTASYGGETKPRPPGVPHAGKIEEGAGGRYGAGTEAGAITAKRPRLRVAVWRAGKRECAQAGAGEKGLASVVRHK
jgi:hypothetical protein